MKGLDLGGMMKQAQKMQKEIARVQEEVKTRVVEATSGGGAVVAQVSGGLELVSIKIDPKVLSPDEKEILEDMIVTAVSQATAEAQRMVQKEISKVTGGAGLPGLM